MANTGAKLQGLFFLEHADRDWIKKLEPSQVRRRLLTSCWPPVWDRQAMGETMALFSKLAKEIPSYSLGFRPEPHILKEIRHAV